MTPAAGTVAVVIPTWNRADLLRGILACVKQQTYPIHRIIVVDNGSSDGSAEQAEAAGAAVIRLPENVGFAAAVNRGLNEAADVEWVAVINNDVTLPLDWLSTLVGRARSNCAAFATGKLLNAAHPERIDGTFDLICRGGLPWRCGYGRLNGRVFSDERPIAFASFTAVLLNSAAVRQVGLLDERFVSYLEDVDWSLRAARKKLTGLYVPAAVGMHAGSATLGPWRNNTVRLLARNQILLCRKHLRGGPWWPRMVARLLWFAMAAKHGAAWAALRGFWEGLRMRSAAEPASTEWATVRAAVEASESEILAIQRQTGFDLYWRLYFGLTWR